MLIYWFIYWLILIYWLIYWFKMIQLVRFLALTSLNPGPFHPTA